MSVEEYHTNGTLGEEGKTERRMIIDPQVFWKREKQWMERKCRRREKTSERGEKNLMSSQKLRTEEKLLKVRRRFMEEEMD